MQSTHFSSDTLIVSLGRRLASTFPAWTQVELERLPDKGLAHEHVRLKGTGVLARIPKQSQMRLPAAENFAYQMACFERASVSGHTPILMGYLTPDDLLPNGALLVEEIVGIPANLPECLPSMMAALAAIHSIEVPHLNARAPLQHAANPGLALIEEIDSQAQYLQISDLSPRIRGLIDVALTTLKRNFAQPLRSPITLIAFDGHPGNFLIQPSGKAVLVDLEKCRYSYPSLDLAHSTLYTSTTWDIESNAVLNDEAIFGAYSDWGDAVGHQLSDSTRPWHDTLRSAMCLWSLTWCVKWLVLSDLRSQDQPQGENWSESLSEATLVTHVRERVNHYLSEQTVCELFEGLERFRRFWNK